MRANFKTGLKICSKCRRELSIDNFQKCNYRSDKLHIYCKECNLKVQHKYIEKHYEEVQTKRKQYRESEHGREVRRKADCKRIERGIAAKYIRNRKQLHPYIKTIMNLRNRVYSAVTKGYKSGHSIDLLGCSVDELKVHLEQQFEPGMTWDNYGEWHIDHIIPCSYFDLTKEEDQRICFNYRNLQPLWAKDNTKKSNKIPDNVEELVEFLKKEIYVNN